jgi:peptidoglycan/LPS O-acetylase OafA/YrhL
MKQIGIIHKLRGIAALMVFLFHVIYLSDNFFNFFNCRTLFYFGKYGIHVFFVISGFIIVHSLATGSYHLGKWKSFILKRFVRLEPPYLIVLLITFGYLILRSFIKGPDKDTPSVSQLFLHIGYLIPFTKEKWLSIVFWSLAVEFQFYFLISFAYPLLVRNAILRWAIYATFWGLQFLFPSMQFFYWSLIFVLGMQLAFYRHNIITKSEFIVSFIAIPILIYCTHYLEVVLFSFITFLVIYFQKDFKSRILDFFGDISYSLYLVHMLLYVPLFNIALRYFNTGLGQIAMLFVIILFILLGAYLLYRFVEKPSKQYASFIKYTDRFTLKKVGVKNENGE